ncbi:MAG: CerR family C-terminal domain-containing protein [Deltaproteobacteria bacterium]|nr:CerR family C-terminal domain-containing protein [Deltaproteobacteria bacterium]
MSLEESAPSPTETRERLLEAAGEIFAERGFRAATTREICKRAGANVAAINYHFRDKERLYEEVLQFAHGQAPEPLPQLREGGGPEERLLAFVEWFLFRCLGEGRPAWHLKLLLREMAEPSPALAPLVESELRPIFEALEMICREVLAEGASPRAVSLCARSILGQCIYYRVAQPILARLVPEQRYGPEDIRALARHVSSFSLGGLQEVGLQARTSAPSGEEHP